MAKKILKIFLLSVVFLAFFYGPIIAKGQSQNSTAFQTDSTQNQSYEIFTGAKIADTGFGVLLSPFHAFVNFVLLPLLSGLVYLAGLSFELAMNFSVYGFKTLVDGTGTTPGTGFITDVWKLIRDIINVTFIFIILYVAIKTILGSTSSKLKSMIAGVVLSAILINFSLFFTRVIIDASNKVSDGIYKMIINEVKDNTGKTTVSGAFMNAFKLQGYYYKPGGDESSGASSWLGRIKESVSNFVSSAGDFFSLSSLLNAIMNTILLGIVIWMFLQAAILFFLRSIGLVFIMMTSPIGFLGDNIPALKEKVADWWKNLTNFSLLGPVFLIFLLLIVKFIKVGNTAIQNSISANPHTNLTSFNNIGLYVFFFFTVGLMIAAIKETKKLSGFFGNFADTLIKAIIMAITVAITGGASMAVRGIGAAALRGASQGGTVGRVSNAVLGLATSNNRIIRTARGALNASTGLAANIALGRRADEGTRVGRATNWIADQTRSGIKKVTGTELTDISKMQKKWEEDYEKRASKEANKPKEVEKEIKILEDISSNIKKGAKPLTDEIDEEFKRREDKIRASSTVDGKDPSDELNRLKEEKNLAINEVLRSRAEGMGIDFDKLQKDLGGLNVDLAKARADRERFLASLSQGGVLTTGVSRKKNQEIANKLRAGKDVGKSKKDKLLDDLAKLVKDEGGKGDSSEGDKETKKPEENK